MSILFNIVEEARTCKGGALLNAMLALMTGTYAGDEKGRDVMQFLLEKTSVPYMAMLQGWLEGGEIRDPFHEFMIESTESSALGDDSDWNNWYIVRQEHVPMAFLSPNGQSHMTSQRGKHMEDVVKKILTTGKYWNAVRLCEHKQAHSVHNSGSNGCTASDDTEPKTLHMGPLQIAEFIDRAYTCASDTLLSLIMKEYDLMETLRTMKRYFLLDQGDFFVHFLDAAEEELKQELSHVSRGRVQSWLSLSVQLSVGNMDDSPQYDKDNEQGQDGVVVKREMLAHQLCCDFSSQSLIDHLDDLHSQSGGIRVQEARTPSQQVYGAYNQALTGVEAFMLDFQYIPFPTSLVLSRRTLNNYQLLFRHLFFAKHVERRLTNVWADHQMMKELQSLQRALGPTYFLRQRMLHFLQNLVYYMMFEVIEPNFLSMESAILHPDGNAFGEKNYQTKEHQQTVDDVLNIHDEFVRRTLKECLLTNRDLIRNLTKLMTTCLVFSDQMTKFMEATRIVSFVSSLTDYCA
jgi:gamma-tubulin complex component 2